MKNKVNRKVLNFDWEGFSEGDFTEYCTKTENGMTNAGEWIGCARVGELCFDLNTKPECDDVILTFDIYVGGVDSGYGYSSLDAMATGKYRSKYDVPANEQYPYDHAGSESFKDSCISLTYNGFKEMAEKEFIKAIEGNVQLAEKAEMPLHIW